VSGVCELFQYDHGVGGLVLMWHYLCPRRSHRRRSCCCCCHRQS